MKLTIEERIIATANSFARIHKVKLTTEQINEISAYMAMNFKARKLNVIARQMINKKVVKLADITTSVWS